MDYIEEFLSWRVYYKKGITVTAGSTKLALRGVFSTLYIESFFPNITKNIQKIFGNDGNSGFELNESSKICG